LIGLTKIFCNNRTASPRGPLSQRIGFASSNKVDVAANNNNAAANATQAPAPAASPATGTTATPAVGTARDSRKLSHVNSTPSLPSLKQQVSPGGAIPPLASVPSPAPSSSSSGSGPTSPRPSSQKVSPSNSADLKIYDTKVKELEEQLREETHARKSLEAQIAVLLLKLEEETNARVALEQKLKDAGL